MFWEWVSSPLHLSCLTNSTFSETCDLTRHLHLLVQVEWTWPFLKPNQRAFIVREHCLWREYSPEGPSVWEVNIARKSQDPWSFCLVDSLTPSAKEALPEALVAEHGENRLSVWDWKQNLSRCTRPSIFSFSLNGMKAFSVVFLSLTSKGFSITYQI